MSPELRSDNRALAAGILKFIASFAFFALLYGVLNIFVGDLFGSIGLAADGQQLSDTRGYVETAWTALPFIAAVAIAARLITRAVFESGGGAR